MNPQSGKEKRIVAISASEDYEGDVDLDDLLSRSHISTNFQDGPKPILRRTSFCKEQVQGPLSPKANNGGMVSISSVGDMSKQSSVGDSISNLSTSRRSLRRISSQVSFTNVEVREYDRTIGDNPSCMSGPPISLDWSYSNVSEVSVDENEKIRDMRRRRIKNPTRMAKHKRLEILKNDLGYSEEEIKAATTEKKQIQRSRSLTNFVSPLWRVEHAAQSAKRKIARALKKVDKTKEGGMDFSVIDELDLSSLSHQKMINRGLKHSKSDGKILRIMPELSDNESLDVLSRLSIRSIGSLEPTLEI
mmetsp:Transcript_18727/g.22955  ORF Transcript_18727/g.22955 Transcript_18727/m.22955 type:complete len:304 (-) Transcript_18727:2740-3651(-)